MADLKEFAIKSSGVINLDEIRMDNLKWNEQTLKWEKTTEVVVYRHAEIKGKRVYCRMNPELTRNLPFEGLYSKSIEPNYNSSENFYNFIIELAPTHIIKKELKKPGGGYIDNDDCFYVPDPQFDVLKKEDDKYMFRITLDPVGLSGEGFEVYKGIYEKKDNWQTEEEGYYIIPSNLEYVTLNMENKSNLLHKNSEDIGNYLLRTDLKLNENRFFGSNEKIPDMRLRFQKFNRNGRFYISDGGFSIRGIGRGTVKVYKPNGEILRDYSVNNKIFKVQVDTSWATGAIVGATFTFDGTSNTLNISEFGNYYVDIDMEYWNEESEIYLESV